MGKSANSLGKTIGKSHHFIQKILHSQEVELRSKKDSHRAGFPFFPTDMKYGHDDLEYGERPVFRDHKDQLFIFRKCSHTGLDRRVPVIYALCDNCQIPTIALKTRKKRRFCSAKCQYAMQTGEHNPNWTGGRKKKTSGHILIYAPDHPNAVKKFVPEHRLVMEEHLERYLLSSEVVHHINGIKDDNVITNLCLCSPSEHTAIHNSLIPLLRHLLVNGSIVFDRSRKEYVLGSSNKNTQS